LKSEEIHNTLLSKKAIKELLQDPVWNEDESLSKSLGNNHIVYAYPDGRILQRFPDNIGGQGRLYPNRAEFEKFLKMLEKASQHFLAERLPQGEHFIQEIPTLIDGLAKTFKLPRETLDNSIESLQKIDEGIRKYGKGKSLEAPVFPMLVAYAGEVVRQQTNGFWEMRLSGQDHKTWEPWIVDPQGRAYNVSEAIFVQLTHRKPFSVALAMKIILRWPTTDPTRVNKLTPPTIILNSRDQRNEPTDTP
jgi:hypothetical protein